MNEVLAGLDGDFAKIYSTGGRPSIAPERLLRALLLQAFYTIRSERQLMEQLDYNLLYPLVRRAGDGRAGVGGRRCSPRTAIGCWRPTLRGKFLAAAADHGAAQGLLSDEHFSVDGTLIEAWASMKSFRAKDGCGEPPGAGPQWRARLSRREAQQRDACLDHRSGGAAVSQGAGARKPSSASWATC